MGFGPEAGQLSEMLREAVCSISSLEKIFDQIKPQLSGFIKVQVQYRYRDRNRYRNRGLNAVFSTDFDPDPDSDFDED